MFDINFQNNAFDTTATVASNKTLALVFMERLANDDAFRAETLADPVAACAMYGFGFDRSDVPEGGITLPSKEIMQEHLVEIADRFLAAAKTVKCFSI